MKADFNNSSNFHPKIWVLIDNRAGNANQALALAANLNSSYQIQKVEYNSFAILPNFLLTFWPINVKKLVLDKLKSQDAPDIIISSGRRTAPLAIYLKKIFNNKIKIIQIMRPGLNPKSFDLIILPQHDNYNYTLPNIVRVIGALNKVQASMPDAKVLLRSNYPDIKHFIAVIIGGSSKRYHFTNENAESLSNTIRNISENHSLPVFITFSRRTPKEVKEIFKNKFSWPNIIYDPEENLPNPYPGIIGEGDYIITTTDSISMCSEAASTGKPIYVFCPENFKLKKHRFFIQQLADLNIIKILEPNTAFLVKYSYEPLHEIDKATEIVKKRFF
jgi:mitochondrial fission protein ELM1